MQGLADLEDGGIKQAVDDLTQDDDPGGRREPFKEIAIWLPFKDVGCQTDHGAESIHLGPYPVVTRSK